MAKTIAEINEKIRRGEAVVVTAEEIIDLVDEKGVEEAARSVDVITTGTFGPMCSSGAFINLGHPQPRIKISRAWLNGVPVFCGIAAVDVYVGATEMAEHDPLNEVFPGEFRYGGGHVIEDPVAGRRLRLRAESYGTDCYPRREWEREVTLADVKEAWLFNPRNAYQNYNVAVNLSDRVIYTYMGVLRPGPGNANYCSAGQLSPLLNDPLFRTIGIGTRIFLGGGVGYVAWHGTQHNTSAPRAKGGAPTRPAGTISVIGDLRGMSPRYLTGYSMLGYGASLAVGIGIPIPVLDEEVVSTAAVRDEDLVAPVVDYSHDYPQGTGKVRGDNGVVSSLFTRFAVSAERAACGRALYHPGKTRRASRARASRADRRDPGALSLPSLHRSRSRRGRPRACIRSRYLGREYTASRADRGSSTAEFERSRLAGGTSYFHRGLRPYPSGYEGPAGWDNVRKPTSKHTLLRASPGALVLTADGVDPTMGARRLGTGEGALVFVEDRRCRNAGVSRGEI